MGTGVEGPEGDISDVVGELDGLDENRSEGRFFFLSTFPEPAGALSGGSSIGVNVETSDVKMLKLFLRRFDMIGNCEASS